MEYSGFLRTFIVMSTLATASVTDIMHHKVYNRLLLTAAVCISMLHVLYRPVPQAVPLGFCCAFLAVLVLLHTRRMIGGADIKLYLLTTFAWPDERGLRIICCSLAAAAVFSAWKLLRGGLWKRRLKAMRAYMERIRAGGDRAYFDPERDGTEAMIPMAVFILLGTGIAAL